MWKTRFIAVVLIAAGMWIGHFDYTHKVTTDTNQNQVSVSTSTASAATTSSSATITDTATTSSTTVPIKAATKSQTNDLFKLGLDLSGGVYLEYQVDVSSIPPADVPNAMAQLRDLIEKRVNTFGVSEPVVQTKNPGLFGLGDGTKTQRLVVQLPGVDTVEQAKQAIGGVPVLEFREPLPKAEVDAILKARQEKEEALAKGLPYTNPLADQPIDKFALGGKNLSRASLQFDSSSKTPGGQPIVSLEFDQEGGKLFADLTKRNAGGTIAIYVDGKLISNPTVGLEFAKTGITGGKAIISGNFTVDSAKELANRLNDGALPVDKMDVVESRTIGATLGERAIAAGEQAAMWGLLVVVIFMVVWYRLPGVVAAISLCMYTVIILALFKIIPVTLTAPGIAGFILSIGMAVDANILIFERMKEELRGGRTIHDAIKEGFSRAWPSTRDGNLSSTISAVILFWFGSSLVKGFALTFIIGILVSLFSAITLTRTFLFAIAPEKTTETTKKLFGAGFFNSK